MMSTFTSHELNNKNTQQKKIIKKHQNARHFSDKKRKEKVKRQDKTIWAKKTDNLDDHPCNCLI